MSKNEIYFTNLAVFYLHISLKLSPNFISSA